MSESYIFAYDPDRTVVDEQKLVVFVSNAKLISEWSHPFRGVFFLISDSSSRELRDLFGAFLGTETKLFVSPIGTGESHGLLPQPVWDWLFQHGVEPTDEE